MQYFTQLRSLNRRSNTREAAQRDWLHCQPSSSDQEKSQMTPRPSIYYLAVVLSLLSCSERTAWTAEEKTNAIHFMQAAESDLVATQILNKGLALAAADYSTILAHRHQALKHAQLVRDDVLEKALPGMSSIFRAKFQRSLELQIRNLEVGDAQAEVSGSRLHDEWVDWISVRDVKIPR